MTTDVSAALATLQLHPEDSQALKALAAVHPGNGAGIDADVLSKALSDARRFHRERGDYELCVSLIDLELAWTTAAMEFAIANLLLAGSLELLQPLVNGLRGANGHLAAALIVVSLVIVTLLGTLVHLNTSWRTPARS